MTIERTKEIFGDKMKGLTDEEVLAFIQDSNVLLEELLQIALKKNDLTQQT